MSMNLIKPIKSDSDYDATLEEIERLFASEPGSEAADRLEVLTVLAQDYQRTHFPVGPPNLLSAIEFELDRRGVTSQDKNTDDYGVVVSEVAQTSHSARRPDLHPASVR